MGFAEPGFQQGGPTAPKLCGLAPTVLKRVLDERKRCRRRRQAPGGGQAPRAGTHVGVSADPGPPGQQPYGGGE